jgi:H+/Cl- antiporter ClcA
VLLFSLEPATRVRESHLWLIAFPPASGLVIGRLYYRFRQFRRGGQQAPARRVSPTAGREGTAQTRAAFADQITRPLCVGPAAHRSLLMAGTSGGFGPMFGTPFAGAIFGSGRQTTPLRRHSSVLYCGDRRRPYNARLR